MVFEESTRAHFSQLEQKGMLLPGSQGEPLPLLRAIAQPEHDAAALATCVRRQRSACPDAMCARFSATGLGFFGGISWGGGLVWQSPLFLGHLKQERLGA